MLVLKRMYNDTKLLYLKCSFSKLTEANKQYVIGLVEGLKYAQGTGNCKLLVKTSNNSHDAVSDCCNH